ncbi:MAG TPA: ABC transporter permease [Spirochaetota bacterium]|jgi:peptide/nickel transport system permease protein/dipeptide transport system permease protein|nr:ABC transporter permease [Spirochaetota bacterium]OQA94938.1 MAG: Dipeptide transport system permease protein DppC [Spirochaetes bacterium ADurb.Bin218]HON15824.1 ABC transporter permease [Spirochaetota bacterium]HOQ12054.1 ABC transporter permease [Spirochaetota bacterium]HOV09895.1 ABC transporter permease [Spirochaetota bacterium]
MSFLKLFKSENVANNSESIWYENWQLLKKNKSAMFGLYIIIFFVLIAIFAPVVAPFDPYAQNIDIRKLPFFSWPYILGTDDFGRDILSRIIYGARISLVIGFISVSISLIFGSFIGLISGFYGGWIDKISMRIIDIMLAFPYILLTIVIVALLGPTLLNAMIAIGIARLPQYARIMRASVLAEKAAEYVEAEKSLGVGNVELMFRSILPNCLAPIIVQATLGVGSAIIESAALSFLGLGAQPPTPEWGLMIASAREFVSSAWWIVTFPGIAILFVVLGFNLLGDGIRDVLDPRLKD